MIVSWIILKLHVFIHCYKYIYIQHFIKIRVKATSLCLLKGFNQASTSITAQRLHTLLMAADKGMCSMFVLLDLSAAFDTIDNGILLNRLRLWVGISDTVLYQVSCVSGVSFRANFILSIHVPSWTDR